jgi:hypothetical protein
MNKPEKNSDFSKKVVERIEEVRKKYTEDINTTSTEKVKQIINQK